MAEVPIREIKFKEGGFRLFTDSAKKLSRDEWTGKFDEKEMEEAMNIGINEMRKFPKGELLYLHDATKADMRLWTPAQVVILKRLSPEILSHVKKFATVYSSFVHQKSTESTGVTTGNHKIFTSLQEAMKWLQAD